MFRRFLCKIGWHAYDFAGIALIPVGALISCRFCKKEAYQSWL